MPRPLRKRGIEELDRPPQPSEGQARISKILQSHPEADTTSKIALLLLKEKVPVSAVSEHTGLSLRQISHIVKSRPPLDYFDRPRPLALTFGADTTVAPASDSSASVHVLFKRALESLVKSGMTPEAALDLLSQASLERIEEIGAQAVADNITKNAAGDLEIKIHNGFLTIRGADKQLTYARLREMAEAYFHTS